MSEIDEARWRKGLAALGKETVEGELRMGRGYPDEPIYGVVFEAPFPTRSFCQQWCTEQDGKLFSFSWRLPVSIMGVVIVASGIFVAARGLGTPTAGAFGSDVKTPRPSLNLSTDLSGAPRTQLYNPSRANTSNSNAVTPTTMTPGTPTAGLAGSSSNQSSVCAYATYDSAQCGRIGSTR
jgi:hypothetical protein